MIAPARLAALDALARIEAGGVDFGTAVDLARRALADRRDRALMLELTAGVLRMRGAIDYQIGRRLHRPLASLDPMVRDVLRLGAYQLLYLSKARDAAVVNDAVSLTRRGGASSASGMVNAVLRALVRDRSQLSWPERPASIESASDRRKMIEHLATVHSHPVWLVARWLERHGPDATEQWLAFNNRVPPLTLAANRLVIERSALQERLAAEGIETRPAAHSALGLIVERGQPLDSPSFRDGLFVVQDEASQLVAAVAGVSTGERVLDLCAAPGGKTLSLAAAAGPSGTVVAGDVRRRRIRLLASTLARCHATAVRVVALPAGGRLPFRDGSFHAILIDAPCSGLGTIRRDPDIRWRRDPAELPAFAAAQRTLLERAADLVRAGGRIIYSTCSSEPDENDEVVSAFLAGRADFSQARRWQTDPMRDGLEAFFASVLLRGV
jgi:16S rRNA (cytosine967-C5)-methyltransferase